MVVEIADRPPLDVYFNRDSVECMSVNIVDIFDDVTTPRVQVVVKDSDGTTVAAKSAPKFGGQFISKSRGCSVPVRLTVPFDEFYEVSRADPLPSNGR